LLHTEGDCQRVS